MSGRSVSPVPPCSPVMSPLFRLRTPVSFDPEGTRRTVNERKCGEAPGVCGIYTDMFEAGGSAALMKLHTLCCAFGTQASVRSTVKRALSFRFVRKRMTPGTVTTTGKLPTSLYHARSRHIFLSTASVKSW